MEIALHFGEASGVSRPADAREFSTAFGSDVAAWWNADPEPDWMIWLAGSAGVETRLLVEAALRCTKIGLNLIPDGEHRPAKTLDVVEGWIRGRATKDDCRQASNKLFKECKLTDQFEDQTLAAAAMSVVGACEILANAASLSDDRATAIKFSIASVRRTLNAFDFAADVIPVERFRNEIQWVISGQTLESCFRHTLNGE